MGKYAQKMKDDVLSFSRISSFGNCNYEFKMHYFEGIDGEGNFFSEVGSAMHKVLEQYSKKEIDIFDLQDAFDEAWSEYVIHEAPPNNYVNINDQYYQQCVEYLENLVFDFSKYEILGVEKEVHFTIGEYKFVGYIDLLLKDKDGNVIICDHKSANIKKKKNGDISKTSLEQFDHFKKQLYLYSLGIDYDTSYLRWNLFRTQDYIIIPFNKDELEDTKKWALNRIKQISDEELFLPNTDNEFYCRYLCSLRNQACEYKN